MFIFLIQLYVPLKNNSGQPFPRSQFEKIQQELTEHFGGSTAYTRTPADGLWQTGDRGCKHDDIAIFEVLTESLDKQWWEQYRQLLENDLSQESIQIIAQEVCKL